MWLDKAQTWALAEQLGGAALTDLIVEHTRACSSAIARNAMRGATAAAGARPARCGAGTRGWR